MTEFTFRDDTHLPSDQRYNLNGFLALKFEALLQGKGEVGREAWREPLGLGLREGLREGLRDGAQDGMGDSDRMIGQRRIKFE